MTAALGRIERALGAAIHAREAMDDGDREEAAALLGACEDSLGRALAELREGRP